MQLKTKPIVDHPFFQVDLLTHQDVEQLASIVGAHFIQKEPLAHALGITLPEMKDFLRPLLTESARMESGLLLRIKPEHCPGSKNDIIGYLVGTGADYEFPEKIAQQLSPKVLSVFTLLEQLAEQSTHKTPPSETLMVHMIGVTFEFVEGLNKADLQKLGAAFKPVWLPAMVDFSENHPGFKGAGGQTTNPGSTNYAKEAGWTIVGYLPYENYTCPIFKDKVFQAVPGGCTQFAFGYQE